MWGGGGGVSGYLIPCTPEINHFLSLFPKFKILIFCVHCSPKLPLFPCSLILRPLFFCFLEINTFIPLFLKTLGGPHKCITKRLSRRVFGIESVYSLLQAAYLSERMVCHHAKCCNNAKCYKLQHFALTVESYKNEISTQNVVNF